jgi:type IV secretion system protein VirB5
MILLLSVAAVLALAGAPARAVMAVVDVRAIAQLAQQLRTLQAQAATLREQLTETRAQLAALTGGRGMERLLAGTPRNYLPADFAELEAAARGARTAHGPLAAAIEALIAERAVLSGAALARLAPEARASIEAGRREAALAQALTREALAATSARFAAHDTLIAAIGAAGDLKAILDLQARIAAESTMLANEGAKLAVLFEAAEAERRARAHERRERALRDVGRLRALPPMGL